MKKSLYFLKQLFWKIRFSLNDLLCFLSQAIIRKAKALGLCAKYNNKEKNPEIHKILKMLIYLIFLPDSLIESALDYIEEEALKLGKKMDEDLEKQGKKLKWVSRWQKYFSEYLRPEWIKKVKVTNLSLFKAPKRTNNPQERYHRDLNEELGAKPSVGRFISKL